jgi:hypothetical protein
MAKIPRRVEIGLKSLWPPSFLLDALYAEAGEGAGHVRPQLQGAHPLYKTASPQLGPKSLHMYKIMWEMMYAIPTYMDM